MSQGSVKLNKKRFIVLSQYLKDLSFENYAAQINKFDKSKLSFQIDMNIAHKDINIDVIETTLTFFLEANIKKEKQFVIELTYSTVFKFEALQNQEEKKKMAFTDCPSTMFPFLRQIVFNISRDSGFPPVNLDYIDFQDVFIKNFHS